MMAVRGDRAPWWLDDIATAGREHSDPEHTARCDSKMDARASDDVRVLGHAGVLRRGCSVVDGASIMLASVAAPDISITAINRAGGERFQALRRELGLSSFGMNLIVLEPRQRGRIHAHEHQEEVYLVLDGELMLLVDGEPHTLTADQLARVAPHARRQLVNASDSRLVLLALGGSGEHVGRDGRAWEAWDEAGEGRPPQEVPLPQDLPAG